MRCILGRRKLRKVSDGGLRRVSIWCLTEIEGIAGWRCQDENDSEKPLDGVGTKWSSKGFRRHEKAIEWKYTLSTTFSNQARCSKKNCNEVSKRAESD